MDSVSSPATYLLMGVFEGFIKFHSFLLFLSMKASLPLHVGIPRTFLLWEILKFHIQCNYFKTNTHYEGVVVFVSDIFSLLAPHGCSFLFVILGEFQLLKGLNCAIYLILCIKQ